jgi:hypothetical protein
VRGGERSGPRRRLFFVSSAPLAIAAALFLSACGGGRDAEVAPAPPPPPEEPQKPKYGGPQNFIPNPSFEGDARHWRKLEDTSLARTLRTSKAGSFSVEVGARAARPYGIYVPGAVGYPVTGDVYKLSAWVKAGSASAIGKPVVVQLTESGGPTDPRVVDEASMKLTQRWKRVSVAGRVRGKLRTALDALVAGNREIAIGDTFYVDAVTLY